MTRFGTDHHRTAYFLDAKQQFGRAFLEAFPFTEGLGAVRDRKGAYHIDAEGKPAYSEVFVSTYPFRNGIAAAQDSLGWMHIDRQGRPLYTRRFGWVSEFHEGLCAVRYRSGGYSYIDDKYEAWDMRFRYCSDFSEGYAAVLTEDGFTHIGKEGVPIYPERYDYVGKFSSGLAPVEKEGRWALIDTSGKPVTEWLDRVYEGRNGLYAAVKDGTFGYLGKGCAFKPLFKVSKRDYSEMPRWTDDILSNDWDSCVVFIRHSERRSHFLCNNSGIHGTGLTPHGEDLSRDIGRKISSLKDRKIYAKCSSSRRCITTANCIMAGMGVPAKVEICPEVGPEGRAYIEHNAYDPEDLIRTSRLAVMDQIGHRVLKGWYPNEVIRDNVWKMVTGMLEEDDSLTFCVNHDLFVLPPIAYLTGRFPRNDWIHYCEGLIFTRKGDKYSAFIDGKEYPMYGRESVDVDISLAPTGRTMEMEPCCEVKGWQWVPPESIAWAGEWSCGVQPLCDREGRFFFGRDDGYMVTNMTFDYVGDFSDFTAPIYIDRRGMSHLTDFGDFLNNRWFDEVSGYHEGIAAVRENGCWHYIDIDGKALFGDYDFAGDFNNGEALVLKDGKAFFLNRNGVSEEI